MNKFEEKYGIKEVQETVDFHKKRRMFAIYENELYIAEPNLPYSHAVWFEKEGWITETNDGLVDEIVRGIVDDEGDIYFYVGYDFRIDDETESIFFSHLKELSDKLEIKTDAKIFGGLIRQKPNTKWTPKKEYDTVEDYL